CVEQASKRRVPKRSVALDRGEYKRGAAGGQATRLEAWEDREAGSEREQGGADAHAKVLEPTIREFRAQGIRSVRAIAAELNDRKAPTAKGGEWHATSVD